MTTSDMKLSDVANRMAHARPTILERWRQRALEAKGSMAPPTDQPVIARDVEAILDRVDARLRSDSRAASGNYPRVGVGISSLAEALHELSLLRATIVDACEAEGVILAGSAATVIHEQLDEAAATIAVRIEQELRSELRASDERNALVSKATNEVVWELDLVTRRLRWFGAAEQMLGYPPSSVEDGLEWWREHVHPDDVAHVLRSIDRMIETNDDRWSCEYRFRRSDGTYIPVFDRGCLARNLEGRPERVIGAMFDLSARVRAEQALRESEDRLRLALAAADVGTWEYRPSTRELVWDERTKALWGLSPDVDVSYDAFLAGIHPEDRDRVDQLVHRALDPCSGGTFGVEFRVIDGSKNLERWVMCEGKAFFDPRGTPERFVGTMLDITDRHRAAELRERFIGILGHDLRQPLSVVTFTAASLLRKGDLSAADTYAVRRIAGAGERMSRMIGNLLDFARGRQAGGIPIDPRPADLHAIVRQAVEELQTVHPERPTKLVLQGDGTGCWDPDRLAQVFGNLLNNAATYSPAGTPISIAVRQDAGDVVVQVHNLGPPIPNSDLPLLFDPYRRGQRERRTERPSEGLGLGLYIAREIARAHGGTIDVASSDGSGTLFTVTLPRDVTAPAPR